ncbi:hypothetical protein HPB50_013382 [Hyalomma asiaticum]|uniref:Uncharacterized protein n=1 Tax=Hyalomma asiaticum TaxID=266040 RepID=A0ACB7SQP2_HYAAI|nr:hypothetical protein HPB50_013382 [Hyalomma asiaticum]
MQTTLRLMRKFSAVAFGTSAIVIALYIGVVIGMTAWYDNHQDTGIIVDEPDSNEGVAAGSQGRQGGIGRCFITTQIDRRLARQRLRNAKISR